MYYKAAVNVLNFMTQTNILRCLEWLEYWHAGGLKRTRERLSREVGIVSLHLWKRDVLWVKHKKGSRMRAFFIKYPSLPRLKHFPE